MRDYEDVYLTSETPELVAQKLRDDNSNMGVKCVLCDCKDVSKLYEVRYNKTEYECVDYGVYCPDCIKKIFRI